ncbi:MAG TPA: PadR family transcriptional regulator [Candidatus Acidoferrales bacterium]|nr:PadR family transcriptional regulator [Candidatus Acidoferrales bacterium]
MNHKMRDYSCESWHHVPHFYRAWIKHPKRVYGRVKYLVLLALREQPLSGYEIIKTLESKHGHAPSPAVVYPTLRLLEDQGYVRLSEQENKKVYALTEEGEKCLEENRERIDQLTASLGQLMWNSLPGIGKRVASLAGTIFSNCSYLDDVKTKRIEDVLDETRKRVGDIIFGNQAD